MKIWILNHYAGSVEYGMEFRHYYFAEELIRKGHYVTIFAGSYSHLRNYNPTFDGLYSVEKHNGIRFAWVKTNTYSNNGVQRIKSMTDYYFNVIRVARMLKKHAKAPDLILASSPHPLTCLAGLGLKKMFGVPVISEIRDLWPESIVAYKFGSKSNLLVKMLYRLEKYIYVKSDKLIFTMENAYQYIIDKGWDEKIPKNKVSYINNGTDKNKCDQDKLDNPFSDSDLDNQKSFNVVFTGTVSIGNDMDMLLDVAKMVKTPSVKFLIWGDGDAFKATEEKIKNEKINNVVLKGHVEKKYIPSIISKADLNIMHGPEASVGRYGLSANKLFDYASAGRPILTDFYTEKNPAEVYHAGLTVSGKNPKAIAEVIDRFAGMDENEYQRYCNGAIKMAEEYSFERLTMKLIDIINSL